MEIKIITFNKEHFIYNEAAYYDNDISFPIYNIIFDNGKYYTLIQNVTSGNEKCWLCIGIEDHMK